MPHYTNTEMASEKIQKLFICISLQIIFENYVTLHVCKIKYHMGCTNDKHLAMFNV